MQVETELEQKGPNHKGLVQHGLLHCHNLGLLTNKGAEVICSDHGHHKTITIMDQRFWGDLENDWQQNEQKSTVVATAKQGSC